MKQPGLQDEMRNFAQQEAFHATIHRRFNQLLQSWGHPVVQMDHFAARIFALVDKLSSTKLRSAIAVAGEHFIGELGNVAITEPNVFADADPRVARMFLWHGYEELEHKAVLFDGYADAYGTGFSSYLHRQLGLLVAIGVLIVVLLDNRGFGCIDRLQQACGGASFNNLFKDCRMGPQGAPAIDFAMHARSLGANGEHVANIGELETAMQRARASTRSYLISIDTDPARPTEEGGWWWEVAVPEVSAREAVRSARASYELEVLARSKRAKE